VNISDLLIAQLSRYAFIYLLFFIDAAIGINYVVSNVGRLIKNAFQKMWEEASITQIKELSLHMSGVNEKFYQNPQAGCLVPGRNFNPATLSKTVSFRGKQKLIFLKITNNSL
jgi:hypothetical protein